MAPDEPNKPIPLSSVLTKPVVVTLANCAIFAFLNATAESYFPLVWSTPVEYGGLNLSPASIGLWLSLYGGMGGIFQFVFYSHCVRRFGLRLVFVFSVVSSAVTYVVFPFENLAVAAGDGPNLIVWLLIFLHLSAYCVFDMGYSQFFSLSTLAHADAHETCGTRSLRYNEHVHIVCGSQQTLTWHRIWPLAGGVRDSVRSWTGRWGLVVCVFPDS